MESHRRFSSCWPCLIVIVGLVILFAGWKEFWFLCDDAFIAFRYVSNRRLGFGYVWNPPPFKPVEGYSSFLWVVILDLVWTFIGIEPSDAANLLSLVFSLCTFLLVGRLIYMITLPAAFDPWRPIFLLLSLTGLLSNRTFLAWTSSGLETSLFNLLVVGWIVLAFKGMNTRRLLWGFSLLTILLVLCRPDGILFLMGACAAFLLVATCSCGPLRKCSVGSLGATVAIASLYFAWRFWTYGEYLPNTYYAKYSVPWPMMGRFYLSSFVLEYSFWFWLLVVGLAVIIRIYQRIKDVHKEVCYEIIGVRVIACLVIFLHIFYYTFIIGGDHFEYRVYSYLVPLAFPCFVWSASILVRLPFDGMLLTILFLLLSLPIPWVHWKYTHKLEGREETFILKHAISEYLPPSLHWYGRLFDTAQDGVLSHFVGTRHQEHKVFGYLMRNYWIPERNEGKKVQYTPGDIPVLASDCVGIPGWALPTVAIIDIHGLNDYFIARNPATRTNDRMGHDRWPFPGYVEAFRQNVFFTSSRGVIVKRRDVSLTVEEVRGIEEKYQQRIGGDK